MQNITWDKSNLSFQGHQYFGYWLLLNSLWCLLPTAYFTFAVFMCLLPTIFCFCYGLSAMSFFSPLPPYGCLACALRFALCRIPLTPNAERFFRISIYDIRTTMYGHFMSWYLFRTSSPCTTCSALRCQEALQPESVSPGIF